MRELIRRRPWILIVALLGTMVLANIVLLVVSIRHPAIPATP
ncbi:MAG: hypothetical protein NTY35_06860 [Planctomycetota bacterium]|nr:hypothetical protein [Planctomycetota bacterium]